MLTSVHQQWFFQSFVLIGKFKRDVIEFTYQVRTSKYVPRRYASYTGATRTLYTQNCFLFVQIRDTHVIYVI